MDEAGAMRHLFIVKDCLMDCQLQPSLKLDCEMV
jgi:hypothetical protein